MPIFGSKKKKEEKAAKKAIDNIVSVVDDRMPAEELLNQLFQAMLVGIQVFSGDVQQSIFIWQK